MTIGDKTTCWEAQWWHADRGWIASAGYLKEPTYEQARDLFDKDEAYFYTDIPIRIVRVVKEVILEGHGRNPRP